MRMIDADDYLKRNRPKGLSDDVWEQSELYLSIMRQPTYTPTIDAVPVVRARWVGNNGTFCSNCGKSDANAFNHKISYCWNCGAKMDGGSGGQAQ